MLDSVKTYFKEGSAYYGLELSEHLGKECFSLIEVQRKKGELLITKEETLEKAEDSISFAKKNAPFFIVLNTPNILTKIIDVTDANSEQEAIVDKAFPGLDFTNFYYEITRFSNSTLISVCNKEYFETQLQQFKNLGLRIISISLGFSSFESVSGYVSENKVAVSHSVLGLKDKSIKSIESAEQDQQGTFNVNGLSVSANNALGFSAILGHILKIGKRTSNYDDTVKQMTTDFRNKRYFDLLLRTFLGLLLGSLLLNFLFFNHYYKKVADLRGSLVENNASKSRLLSLKNQVNDKREKVNAVLSAANSKTTYYLDQIVGTIPNSILLTEIQYQPLARPVQASKPIQTVQDIIRISGETSNSSDFYRWIEALEQFSWTVSIETTDYDYQSANTSNFSLNILIDEQ